MYHRFCREKPPTPGNSFCRSAPSRSITAPPPVRLLAIDDQPAEVPVELDQFPVHGEGHLQLRRADARLHLLERLRVARRDDVGGRRGRGWGLGGGGLLAGHAMLPAGTTPPS